MEVKKSMRQIQEEFFEVLLETEDLETVLERYDLAPLEVLMLLYDQGCIIQEAYGYKDGYVDNYELDFENDL